MNDRCVGSYYIQLNWRILSAQFYTRNIGSRMTEPCSPKTPPTFWDKEKDYSTWRNEIDFWRRITSITKKQQAPTIALRLTVRAKQIALSIPADELHDDNGIDKLFEKLDMSFKRDEVDCANETYKNFEICVRREGICITAYILEFERLYEKAKTHKMELPDAILAHKLLENAALDTRERQMALTASQELKYESMKSAMRQIFGECERQVVGTNVSAIKEELVYSTSARQKPGFYQKNADQRDTPYSKGPKQQRRNPLGKDGRITRCS